MMDGVSDGVIYDVVVFGVGFVGLYVVWCCVMVMLDVLMCLGVSGGEVMRWCDFEVLWCVVFEVLSEVGGRVKVMCDVVLWDVNFGLEFLYGDENSVLK